METFNRDNIEEILPRYCSGEATVEECRMVEEWIGQSDENYRIVKQMYTIDQVMGTVQMESKVDMEKALASVSRKMSKAPSHNLVYLGTAGGSYSFYPSSYRFRYSELYSLSN